MMVIMMVVMIIMVIMILMVIVIGMAMLMHFITSVHDGYYGLMAIATSVHPEFQTTCFQCFSYSLIALKKTTRR